MFHRSDSSLLTSLVGLRSLVLCAPFFINCEVMEFAEMGRTWLESPDLPVSLLIVLHALVIVLHALWLECEKSMS